MSSSSPSAKRDSPTAVLPPTSSTPGGLENQASTSETPPQSASKLPFDTEPKPRSSHSRSVSSVSATHAKQIPIGAGSKLGSRYTDKDSVQQPHASSLPSPSSDTRFRSGGSGNDAIGSSSTSPPFRSTSSAIPILSGKTGQGDVAAAAAGHNTSPLPAGASPTPPSQSTSTSAAQNSASSGSSTSTNAAPPTFAAPSSFLRRPGASSPGSGAGVPGVMAGATSAAAQQRFGAYGGVMPQAHALAHGHGQQGQGHVRAGSTGSGHRGSSASGFASALDREQLEGLKAIRAFLKIRTSYDVLPLSFRLIVFDTALLVKKSLNILIQNGIVSAPLWDSRTSTFAGLLTTSDYINVIQYYWSNPDALAEIDQFRLNSLPDVERAIGVQPVETVSIHPDRPLYEACRKMLVSRARRIPLVDFDDETQRAMVVSVVTQYRILKFVAVNVKETQMLRKPLKDLRLGTYGEPGKDLAVASMDTPVMDVIHLLVKKAISSVPILDKDGVVLNVFEGVDVIALIKGGVYDDLQLSVGEALLKRSDEFAGIYTCTLHDRLDTIFDTIRRSRVHRMVVVDEGTKKLRGVLTLSDILEYILLEGESEEDLQLETE